MKIEQALITQLMILLNVKNGKNRPSEISKELDITLQGVVYHLKILREKRYIDADNKITKSGFDFLYNGLNNIENFVHSSLINIDASLIWESISDDDVNGGDRLYLYMKDGYLHATKKGKKAAFGKSIRPTKKDQCAGVTDVNGIIPVMKYGCPMFYGYSYYVKYTIIHVIWSYQVESFQIHDSPLFIPSDMAPQNWSLSGWIST